MANNGAPTLLNPVATAPASAATADGISVSRGGATARTWGIFLNGAQVLNPDSIVAIDYTREWTLANYPMEEGAFSTYNKVQRPFDKRVRMTKGGSESDRRAFLTMLETLAASLDQYDVVTPEMTYLSVNFTRIGYTRSASSGLGLLTIDVALQQVRVTATAAFTNVAQPQSASPTSGGTVQPQTTPAPQQAAVTAAILKQADLPLLALKGQLR